MERKMTSTENPNIQLWQRENYVQHYNKVYTVPVEDIAYYTSFFHKKSNVLDLGCGNATFLRYCREVFGSEGRLRGVDVSPFQEHADLEESLSIRRIQSDF
jgi:hypothetical protein